MGYEEESLVPVMRHIAKNVLKVNDGLTKHLVSEHCTHLWSLALTWKLNQLTNQFGCSNIPLQQNLIYLLVLLQAVKNKYSSQKQMRIALISQLKSSIIKNLAKEISSWEAGLGHNVLTVQSVTRFHVFKPFYWSSIWLPSLCKQCSLLPMFRFVFLIKFFF